MKKYTKLLFKKLLESSGLDQKDFAKQNDISETQMSYYVNGKTSIGFEKACELMDKYQIDLNELLKNKEDE